MLSLHLQYALHTTSFAEQPISDKTLSRLRKRCYDYETLHEVDLYHGCVKGLSGKIAQIMKLNGRVRRMDPLMIESNIRFMSRMELIYTCISKLVVYLTKKQIISEQLKHYVGPNDYNRIFYHQRNDGMEAIIQTLLTDSDCLLHLCRTDFEFNEEGTRLQKCAAIHVPISQSYTKSTKQCRASFDRNHCAGCHIKDNAIQRFTKRSLHLTGQKASDTCRVKNLAVWHD